MACSADGASSWSETCRRARLASCRQATGVPVENASELLVVELEDVVQQECRPFERAERIEDNHEGVGERVGTFDWVDVGLHDRFGKPGAHVVLASATS